MRFDDDAPTLGGQRLTGWELRAILDLLRQRKALLAVPIAVTLVRDALQDSGALISIQTNALARIRTWSPQASAEAFVVAVESAIARRGSKSEVVAVSSEKYT